MIDPSLFFPLHPPFGKKNESHFNMSRPEALIALEKGCLMCKKQFVLKTILHYETTDSYTMGVLPHETAELHLTLMLREPLFLTNGPMGVVFSENVYLVDRKAALCLVCWVEYLRQIVEIAKGSQ